MTRYSPPLPGAPRTKPSPSRLLPPLSPHLLFAHSDAAGQGRGSRFAGGCAHVGNSPSGGEAALKPKHNTRQNSCHMLRGLRQAPGQGLVPVVLGVCGYSDKSWCILHGIKILRLFIFVTGLSF